MSGGIIRTTRDLTAHEMGRTVTFKTRNGNEVTGAIEAIRHRSTGTYLELAGENGVYQTDSEAPIRLEAP